MFFYVEIMDTYRRADGRRHWIGRLLSPDGGRQKSEHCSSNQGAGTPREVARKRHPQKYYVEQPFEIGAGGAYTTRHFEPAKQSGALNCIRLLRRLAMTTRATVIARNEAIQSPDL